MKLKDKFLPLPIKKIGVLLTNLGTPSAPTSKAVRSYLAEFLSDPRVVEIPKWIWQIVLQGIILRIRPRQSAKKYQLIWTPDGSPLLTISQQQTKLLREKLQATYGDNIQVELAMRYGKPSIASSLEKFHSAEIQKIIVLPLYPQYCAATVGSSFDAVTKVLQTWRFVPEINFISGYADFPDYIQAVADSIRAYWHIHTKSKKLLISFHGMPKRTLTLGDPYYCLCHKTARLIAENLQLVEAEWQMVFQSRFGKAKWLQPYCSEVLKQLPTQGINTVDVVCPGFAADCLETLEEISLTYKEEFIKAGGEKLQYIPALNADIQHIEMLAKLLTPYLENKS